MNGDLETYLWIFGVLSVGNICGLVCMDIMDERLPRNWWEWFKLIVGGILAAATVVGAAPALLFYGHLIVMPFVIAFRLADEKFKPRSAMRKE